MHELLRHRLGTTRLDVRRYPAMAVRSPSDRAEDEF